MENLKGKPAFPVSVGENDTLIKGMTLRQYYAGLALQGILVTETDPSKNGILHTVKMAIEYADALIKELEK